MAISNAFFHPPYRSSLQASYVKQLDPVMLTDLGHTQILSVDEPNQRKISSSSQVEVPTVQIRQSGRVWHADSVQEKGQTSGSAVSPDSSKSYGGDKSGYSSTVSHHGSESSRGWNPAKDLRSEIPGLVDHPKAYEGAENQVRETINLQ